MCLKEHHITLFSRCFYAKQHTGRNVVLDSWWSNWGVKDDTKSPNTDITLLTLGVQPATFWLPTQRPHPAELHIALAVDKVLMKQTAWWPMTQPRCLLHLQLSDSVHLWRCHQAGCSCLSIIGTRVRSWQLSGHQALLSTLHFCRRRGVISGSCPNCLPWWRGRRLCQWPK